jgi:redox-sensitive bicupin YhaK (pirin superfamily)
LLQIWLFPNQKGLTPGYEQQNFPASAKRGKLRLIASADGRDGSVTFHQDADIYASLLEPGEQVSHDLRPGRHAWLQMATGKVTVNGRTLEEGDGAALSEESRVTVTADAPAELLLFDLA